MKIKKISQTSQIQESLSELKSFFWVGAQFVDKKFQLIEEYARQGYLHHIQVIFVLSQIISYPEELEIPFSKEDKLKATYLLESVNSKKEFDVAKAIP